MECQAKRLKHRCFPVKFLKTEVDERPILKPAVSPGVSFFISYTCGSNWYLAQQTFVLMKTSWNVFRLRLRETSSRRLQDVLIKTNIFTLPNIFVLAIRLGVFRTFLRRLQDVLQKRLQDIFKTSSKRLQDIFKTSCKDIFSRHIIRLNCLPRSHLWEIYGQCRKFVSVIKISQVLA